MFKNNSLVFFLLLYIFTSCNGDKSFEENHFKSELSSQVLPNKLPNFNYIVEAPKNWTIYDTTMQDGKNIRLLISPKSLKADFPTSNVLIAWMNEQNIDDFINSNINYLKANMPSAVILEKGNIDSTIFGGQWFTYTKEQNGIVREMINYIIPVNGFAYMITCGSNKGSFKRYKTIFDKIAKSFRV